MKYLIRHTMLQPELQGLWESSVWQQAEILELKNFRPESTDHRPQVRAKLLYNQKGLYGIFHVKDKYVRCVHTQFQDSVCQDSCVEFFVKPISSKGYFNFEFNCGGTLLCHYIVDPVRGPSGFKEYAKLSQEDGNQVSIYHSMPKVIELEIQEETIWTLEFFVPFSLFSKYVGPLGDVPSQEWRANFYKCGDKTSHPHWASWSPVDQLNFHLPHCFGTISFENVVKK